MDSSAMPGARPDRGRAGLGRARGPGAPGTRGGCGQYPGRMRGVPGEKYAPGHPCQREGSCAMLRTRSCPNSLLGGGLRMSLVCSFPVFSRQSWALVGILGGDRLFHGNGTRLAVAQRDFLTYDGTRFTVTTFTGWIKSSVFPENCSSSVAFLCFSWLLCT